MRRETLIIIIILMITFGVLGCSNKEGLVTETIQQELTKFVDLKKENPSKKVTVNMSDITEFDWDKLYIFHYGVSTNEINQILGFNWEPPEAIKLPTSYEHNLLVFVKNTKVVQYVEYSTFLGDFKTDPNKYFTSDKAIFSLWLTNPESNVEFHPLISNGI